MGFVHLNVQSEYTNNLNSFIKIDELVDFTKRYNMQAVALTDLHKLYAAVDFFEAAKKEGIKPIIGCKFHFLTDDGVEMNLTMLAKNQKGYETIRNLSSVSHLRKGEKLYITKDELKKCHHDVVVLMDVMNFFSYGLQKVAELAINVDFIKNTIAKEDLYLEIKNHGLELEKKFNSNIITLSKKTNIPLVATNDVFYLRKEEARYREILASIRRNEKFEKLDTAERYFKTEEQMRELFKEIPEAIENTVKIADKCQFEFTLKGDENFKKKAPAFVVPTSFQTFGNFWNLFDPIQGYNQPTDKNEIKTIAYLVNLAWKGFAKFYKRNNERAIKRLKYELGVIISKGYTEYFLVIQDIIRFAKENDIPYGVRGSVLSSLLARCLEITDICPLEYDLQFERFLNPNRTDDPDIDIDVSQKRRYEFIRYIQRKYGKRNVAQIATFASYGLTFALLDVVKTLDIEQKDILAKISKLLPKNFSDVKNVPQLTEMAKKDQKIKDLIRAVYYIQDLPRNVAKHPAGILLSKKSITEEIAVIRDNDAEETFITQLQNNKGQLEKLGFLKIDLLGLRNVDIVDEVKKLVEETRKIKIENIPLDDKKTFELYQKGNLIGVFQVESDGMRESSVKIAPTSIRDIIALLALYRPGPMAEIERYAKNKANDQVVITDENGVKLHGVEGIIPLLQETYGIITYQEQINKIAQEWAGFSLGEADIMRRAIAKKDIKVLKKAREKFITKSIKNNRDEETSKLIYDLIERFANYGFNKAHATGYAIFSYQTAWFKANFPEEYMTVILNSVLASGKDKTKKAASYVMEAKNLGITIFNPDINDSYGQFLLEENGIHFGLSMIKNVGRDLPLKIEAERQKGKFTSFENFLDRMNVTKVTKPIEALIKVGSFDSFGTRKQLMEFLSKPRKINREGGSSFYTFSDIPGNFSDEKEKDILPNVEDYTISEKLAFEQQLAAMYISEDPTIQYHKIVTNAMLDKDPEHWIAGVLLEIKHHVTKVKKEDMAFFIVKHEEMVESISVFPKDWENYKDKVNLFTPYLFKVRRDDRGIGMLELHELSYAKEIRKVEVIIPDEVLMGSVQSKRDWNKRLQEIINRYPGSDDFSLWIGNDEKRKHGVVNISKEFIFELLKHVGDRKFIKVTKSST